MTQQTVTGATRRLMEMMQITLARTGFVLAVTNMKKEYLMNEDTLNIMAKIAEAAAHQTRDGIVDLLTHLAKKSLMDPDIPNYVAQVLVATVATIKEADVADFFTAGDE